MKTIGLKDVIVTWGDETLVGFGDDEFITLSPAGDGRQIARQPETGREEAQARLAAIVAEMERLIPGCTYVSAGVTHYKPRNSPEGHVFYICTGTTLHMDGRNTVDVGEGSWIPRLGPISDGGANLPDDEAPEATARRLLRV